MERSRKETNRNSRPGNESLLEWARAYPGRLYQAAAVWWTRVGNDYLYGLVSRLKSYLDRTRARGPQDISVIIEPFLYFSLRNGEYLIGNYHVSVSTNYSDVRVGGDFVCVKETPDGSFLLCIGDITGHGISKSPGALACMAYFHGDGYEPDQLLAGMNRMLCRLPVSAGNTGFIACFKFQPNGEVLYAGKIEDSVVHKDGDLIGVILHRGPMLGVPDIQEIPLERINLAHGECLSMCSDGYKDPFDDSTLVKVKFIPEPAAWPDEDSQMLLPW